MTPHLLNFYYVVTNLYGLLYKLISLFHFSISYFSKNYYPLEKIFFIKMIAVHNLKLLKIFLIKISLHLFTNYPFDQFFS